MSRIHSHVYEFGAFRLDAERRLLWRGGEPVALTPKVFDVLCALVQNAGQIIAKEQLLQAVWPDSYVEESNLTQTVFVLRKALGEAPEQRYILTVQGKGYRFTPEVTEVPRERVEDRAESAGPARAAYESASAGYSDEHATWSLGSRLLVSAGCGVALLIVAVMLFYWAPLRTQASGVRPMLAVLPFANLTGDPNQEYFSDGLTEEMITQLSNRDPQHLGVIARTSVMHYKNGQRPLDQIGRELGAQYVLEGSVRRDGEKVRITAQLIQMKDQSHLWARQYDRELSHMLAVQGEIAQEISGEIERTLQRDKTATIPAAESTTSYEAYDLYLKGRFSWNKRTPEGFEQAIKYFRQAIDIDPHYARAYAGLADSYAMIGSYSIDPPIEVIPKARAAALKALELDDTLAEAHTSLALIHESFDWDWVTAEKQFRRAIELNPNYATAHQWYAEYLMWVGRFDEAFEESEQARRLDPLSPIIAADNAMIYFYSRQYDRAIEKLNAVVEMEPSLSRAHMVRYAYVQQGRFKEALADVTSFRPDDQSGWRSATFAYIYGRSGQKLQAQRALAQLEKLGRRRRVDPAAFFYAHLGVGNTQKAFWWLEKAYTEHSSAMTTLKVDPTLDSLRSDARFQDFVRRVGLAQ
jgi:TolB-like protein/DNA-binding winged helix-turn-helix (wHTH) protein/Tfp pilus assembly protein PilF